MCPSESQVHAYHDGELSDEQRRGVDAHVQECAECRGLLAELQGLSRMLSEVDLPAMPQRAVSRMYGAFHAAQASRERGVRHLAGWLTAAAAIVLVLMSVRTTPRGATVAVDDLTVTGGGSGWVETVAVMPPLEPRLGSNSQMVQFAQWIASDLGYEEGVAQ